jgi:acetyl esterase/lipase
MNVRLTLACTLLIAANATLSAQPYPNSSSDTPEDRAFGIATVRLWDGPAPGAKGTAPADTPTLTIFSPHPFRGIGTAVIVAPGGAYLGWAANLEGRQVADWFTARGITAFVLKYRLGQKYLYPVPLEDAQRAVRFVRAHAKEYFVAPDRIGMAGFSAGGHLTAMTGTAFDAGNPSAPDPVDRVSSRPDFLVLGYAWIDAMQPPKPHMIASYESLMHLPESEAGDFAEKYTPTLHVTADTPPSFLYSTTDDGTVSVTASVDFYRALVAAGVPAEMHLFGHGAHGSGLGGGDPALDRWPMLLEGWLRGRGLLTPDPAVAAALKQVQAAGRKR